MRVSRLFCLVSLACSAACLPEVPGPQGFDAGVFPSTPGFDDDAGSSPNQSASDAQAAIPASQRKLSCDVSRIVEQRCGLCHGTSPAYGAPMRLVTQADFHGVDPESGQPFFTLASERIHDADSPMPPTSQDPLTEAELAVLSGWLEQGAPEGTCSAEPEFPEQDAAAPELPPTVPGIIYDPILPEDCEQSIELRAHDPNDPSQGFPVSTAQANSYECFVFEVPYDVKMHGLQVEPIIDDGRVLHHWLVYEQAGSSGEDGYYNCTGQHPAAQLLAGWAPGRGATVMPRDVGLKLPEKGSATFVLEVHYNNAAGHQNVRDRSGARVCATSKLKTNEAAVHWLGTEAIFLLPGAGQAVGTCTAPQKSVVLNSWPHMHALGTHMKGELTRKGGSTTEILFDKPFSFDDQRSYDTPVILEPGDRIRTTCSYENDSNSPFVGFGTDSEAEMCYNFVLAYPAGSLASGVSLTGTNSTCIDPL